MDFHAMCSNDMQAVMVLIKVLLAFFVVCAVVHFCTPEVEDDYSLITLAVEDGSNVSEVDRRIAALCFGVTGLATVSEAITRHKLWKIATTIERSTVDISGIVMLAVWITCRSCVSTWAGETIEIQPDQLSAAVAPSNVKEAECGATQDDGAPQDLQSARSKLLESMNREADLQKQLLSDLDATLHAREAMNAALNDQLAALGWEIALKSASWAQKDVDWMQKEAIWKQREANWEHAGRRKLQEEKARTNALHEDRKTAKKAVANFLRNVKTILDGVHLHACLEEFRHTIDEEYAWTAETLKRYVDMKKELCKIYKEKFDAETNDGNSTTKPSAYLNTPQTTHNDVSSTATSGPISKGEMKQHLPPHPDTVPPLPSRIIKQPHPPFNTVAKWMATSASSKSTPEPPRAWALPPHPSTAAPFPPPNTQRAHEPVSSAPFTGEQEASEQELEDDSQPDDQPEHDDLDDGFLFGEEALEDDETVEDDEVVKDDGEVDDEEAGDDEHSDSDGDDDEDHGNSGAAGVPFGGNGDGDGDSADDQGQNDDSDAQDHRRNEPHQQDPEEDGDEDNDSDEDDDKHDGDAGAAGVAFAPPGDNGSDTSKENGHIDFFENDGHQESELTHYRLNEADEAYRATTLQEDEDPQDTTKLDEDDEVRQAKTLPEDDEPQDNNELEEDDDDHEATAIEEDDEPQGTTELDPSAGLPQDQAVDPSDTTAPQRKRTRQKKKNRNRDDSQTGIGGPSAPQGGGTANRKHKLERKQWKKDQAAEAPISTEEEAEAERLQVQATVAAKKAQPTNRRKP